MSATTVDGSCGGRVGAWRAASLSLSFWSSWVTCCFSLVTRGSGGLEGAIGPSMTSISTGCARSLGATHGTNLRTSLDIKDSFLGEGCKPLLDLISPLERARTGGLLSRAEVVDAADLSGLAFDLRENLRVAVMVVLVEVVLGWVLVVAARELLSLSAAFALSRSSEETTVCEPFWMAPSEEDAGVSSCACACALAAPLRLAGVQETPVDAAAMEDGRVLAAR